MADETTDLRDQSKSDLQDVAEVVGVPKSGTKDQIASRIEDAVGGSSRPVQVNLHTRRSGDDALLGSWVDVVDGEHRGRRGHYFDDVSHGSDGYPSRVLVRSRDSSNELLEVNYSDIRPTEYTGGR